MKKKRINDLLLIAFVFIIAIILILVIKLTTVSGNTVKIEQNAAVLKTYSINDTVKYNIYNNSGDICNTVLIENGSVEIIYADCDDKICVNHKKIKNSGESIICLPNKVVVSIENNSESEPDGVAK